jgi:GTP-binding protein HflX
MLDDRAVCHAPSGQLPMPGPSSDRNESSDRGIAGRFWRDTGGYMTSYDDTADYHVRRQGKRLSATVTDLEVDRQRAFLVGVVTGNETVASAETSLDELALLTDTAGSDPIEVVLLRRGRPDPATFVGKGQAARIAGDIAAGDMDVAVFDNELSPAQQRNLQKLFHVDVVDRTALILDIFAQHATSREGMLQVELAQHRYRLPRLRGRGTEMSRLGGGIGTRGPGETQLETDRRRILDRIRKLEKELKEVGRSRATRSKSRRRTALPLIAIAGYTNAGKSTLFNRLTDAGVLVEDRLFATLDSTIRKLQFSGGAEALLSDTVGFVRRLPTELVEAFRSTLEEVNDADLIVHLVDGSDPDADRQIATVRQIMGDIGAAELPELLVINKSDAAERPAIDRLLALNPDAMAISAVTGDGVPELLDRIQTILARGTVEMSLVIPYERGDALSELHRSAEIVSQEHASNGTSAVARVPQELVHRFEEFVATIG